MNLSFKAFKACLERTHATRLLDSGDKSLYPSVLNNAFNFSPLLVTKSLLFFNSVFLHRKMVRQQIQYSQVGLSDSL